MTGELTLATDYIQETITVDSSAVILTEFNNPHVVLLYKYNNIDPRCNNTNVVTNRLKETTHTFSPTRDGWYTVFLIGIDDVFPSTIPKGFITYSVSDAQFYTALVENADPLDDTQWAISTVEDFVAFTEIINNKVGTWPGNFVSTQHLSIMHLLKCLNEFSYKFCTSCYDDYCDKLIQDAAKIDFKIETAKYIFNTFQEYFTSQKLIESAYSICEIHECTPCNDCN